MPKCSWSTKQLHHPIRCFVLSFSFISIWKFGRPRIRWEQLKLSSNEFMHVSHSACKAKVCRLWISCFVVDLQAFRIPYLDLHVAWHLWSGLFSIHFDPHHLHSDLIIRILVNWKSNSLSIEQSLEFSASVPFWFEMASSTFVVLSFALYYN